MPPLIRLSGRAIGEGQPCYVIAEIGINHDGDEALAAEMIDAAANCGADAAKLQVVDADASYLRDTPSFEEFSSRALSADSLSRLIERAKGRGIHLFATPGDLPSLELIVGLGMPAIKISSGSMTHTMLVRAAARTGLPLVISTGMATLEEVRVALGTISLAGGGDVGLLQCTSLYPAPLSAANLRAMDTMRQTFSVPVGYSDHCVGTQACEIAVARGASIIEKHFTIYPTRPGADHRLSCGPSEFAGMVRAIREIEAMLGTGEKSPHAAEAAFRSGRHRYLVAKRPLVAGEVLLADMLIAKRTLPNVGQIPAQDIDRVLGCVLSQSLDTDEPLRPAHIAGAT